jgi:hypothetical protein
VELLQSPSHVVQKSLLQTIGFIIRVDANQATMFVQQTTLIQAFPMLLGSVEHEVRRLVEEIFIFSPLFPYSFA